MTSCNVDIGWGWQELRLGLNNSAVWVARRGRGVDPEVLENPERLAILTTEETQQWRSMSSTVQRERFLAGRWLLRHALSSFSDRPRIAWSLVLSPWGRPELADSGSDDLHFSLSHAPGLVVCAVARDRAVGIDVERVALQHRFPRLARLVCAASEQHSMERRDPVAYSLHFLRYWTLKEAYAKATGAGLSNLRLAEVVFDLGPERSRPRRQIKMAADLLDSPAWEFHQFGLGLHHVAALALRKSEASHS